MIRLVGMSLLVIACATSPPVADPEPLARTRPPPGETVLEEPPADSDHDGVRNPNDRCPDEPEDKDGFEDSDGCPDLDNDQDRILDVNDKCPNEPEDYNRHDDDDGCPDERARDLLLPGFRILDKLFFDKDRALPKPISSPLLDAIAESIKMNISARQIAVDGHTAVGEPDSIAVARASAIVEALVARGVERQRLVPRNLRRREPLCNKRHDDCRAQNRFVDFKILWTYPR